MYSKDTQLYQAVQKVAAKHPVLRPYLKPLLHKYANELTRTHGIYRVRLEGSLASKSAARIAVAIGRSVPSGWTPLKNGFIAVSRHASFYPVRGLFLNDTGKDIEVKRLIQAQASSITQWYDAMLKLNQR